MYLSLNWLKDFVDIPKSISPDELGLRLTMHTVEIDSVENQEERLAKIVVGKILEIKKHPNADKLRLAIVDIGNSKQEIVCGAPNIEAGQMVPVALIGAELPGSMKIEETEIRGVKSCGMLCAEDELGLGDDHAGILILDEKAKTGQSLAEYLKLDDTVFEVENKSITHRPDLWSHLGVARDISAFLNTKKTNLFKQILAKKISVDSEEKKLKVKVEDFKLCSRYMGIIIDGIKIEPSPDWLQKRLISVGSRPINNIVDITNYVMLELGQPLHAFDLEKVDEIIVRSAKKGEQLVTLDGENRKLDEDMLVIADSSKPIAIAGVMGGANSEISESTTTIILESANFDFTSIRKTSQKLGLRTEASQRFEKGLDPNLSGIAVARTIELIKKICSNAKVVSAVVDAKKVELFQRSIELEHEWLNKFIGTEIKDTKVAEILTSLGFEAEKQEDKLLVKVPTWRATRDISIKEDLAEEVARIFGYDKVTPLMPRLEMKKPKINQENQLLRKIRTVLAFGAGLTEVYNYSFVGQEQLKKLGIDHASHVKLLNPISTHQTLLRQNLAPNMLENIKINQARYDKVKLFEIGNIFLSITGEMERDQKSGGKLPYQERKLGIVLAGNRLKDIRSEAKGIVEYLIDNLGQQVTFTKVETRPNWAKEISATQININEEAIGFIYELEKSISQKIGIKKEVVLAEISIKEISKYAQVQGAKKFLEFEKYPPAARDIAFVVNKKILYNDIREEILGFHKYIKKAELFDVFEGEKIGVGKKNLAFHVTYQAEKTLTSEEVDKIQKKLIKRMEEKFEAKVRDF